jgi:hypothetical protein
MRHHRTLRRCLLAVATAFALIPVAPPAPAGAAEIVKPIIFPVEGKVTYTDTYGACRDGCSRQHEGQDLMGKKMQRLLAAVDGVVHRVTFNNATGNSVVIRGADGWTYHYIHVNNDTPGTDDGKATRAQAFPSSIVLGARVHRGQVVGYLGDSGNAEATAPHLHFEIRQPPPPGSYTGAPINAYESLRRAIVWSTVSFWELRGTATAGPADQAFTYGTVMGDQGLLCDWDADGAHESVIYRAGTWFGRNGTSTGANGTQFTFGTAADTPLCGDVDGDGTDEAIIFRAGRWTVRSGFAPGDGVAWSARYGILAGDKPVIGDWDGDGDDDLAIKRGADWLLRSGAQPSGTTTTTFRFGTLATDLPAAGDWDGDGDDDPAIFRAGTWFVRSTASATGAVTRSFDFGASSGKPLVWQDAGALTAGIGTFRPRTA